jgi:hypothetical protein
VPYVMVFGYSVNLRCFADPFNAHNMTFDQNICLFLKYYYLKGKSLLHPTTIGVGLLYPQL